MISKDNFIYLLFFIISCSSNKKEALEIDQSKAKLYFQEKERVLLVSCLKCSCFIPAIESAYNQDSSFLRTIYMATDTGCNSYRIKFEHVSQSKMDEISDNLYNVVLFKLKRGTYITRVIDSKESPQIIQIAKSFFE